MKKQDQVCCCPLHERLPSTRINGIRLICDRCDLPIHAPLSARDPIQDKNALATHPALTAIDEELQRGGEADTPTMWRAFAKLEDAVDHLRAQVNVGQRKILLAYGWKANREDGRETDDWYLSGTVDDPIRREEAFRLLRDAYELLRGRP